MFCKERLPAGSEFAVLDLMDELEAGARAARERERAKGKRVEEVKRRWGLWCALWGHFFPFRSVLFCFVLFCIRDMVCCTPLDCCPDFPGRQLAISFLKK